MKFKTTFWQDFEIANRFGVEAIKDTFDRAFKEWKSNTEYLTELVIVLNWQSWKNKDNIFCPVYIDLYYKAKDYALDNLEGDDLNYFLRTTD